MGTISARRAEGAERNFPYTPDYAIPPGDTLEETLEELGMSQSEFARRTGRPEKTINEIIKGKTAITPETAFQFERVTGISARLWLNLERDYRAALVRQAERERLKMQTGWLDKFPYRDLVKRGLLKDMPDPIDRLVELLRFFSVADFDAWAQLWENPKAAYRHAETFASEPKALAAWLRSGEIEAQKIACEPYDRAAFLRVLREIRGLTPQPLDQLWGSMVALCASGGVALVCTRELPGTHVSGATRWLGPQKAILQVSFRYLRDDQVWFSFFHEAAHILLHGKRERFVDSHKGNDTDEAELEANRWAAEFLISRHDLQAFIDLRAFDPDSIRDFASSQGISAGIVVGQLQRRKLIHYSRCNGLKQSYKWVETEE